MRNLDFIKLLYYTGFVPPTKATVSDDRKHHNMMNMIVNQVITVMYVCCEYEGSSMRMYGCHHDVYM
jgi:hypothetical protein